MPFLDFLKTKKNKEPEKKEIEVPPAPPTTDELPDFPSEPVKKPEQKAEKPAMKQSKPVFHKEEKKPIEKPHTITPHDRLEERAVEKEEEKAVKIQRHTLNERDDLKLAKPIFVEAQLYKDMADEICLVKNLMKENEDTLLRLSEFKQDEDKEFNKWQNQIQDIQRKLIYADKTLFITNE